MRIQSTTADQAAQVAAAAQTSQTLIHTYGKPISKVKTAFQMPKASFLSKEQIKHTHYLLKSELTPNFGQIIDTFRKLLVNAPCAIYKDAELRRAMILLSSLKSIHETANRDDYFEEVPMNGEHKTLNISGATRHLNYASLQAMSSLRDYSRAMHHDFYPRRHALAGQLLAIILNLYVPKLSDDEEFCMDAILNLLIEYDQ